MRLLMLLSVCVVVACGADPPLTVPEYAETVCGYEDEVLSGDAETWGELRSAASAALDLYDVNAPDEVQTWHDAMVASFDLFERFAREQPAGDEFNPFLLLTDPSTLARVTALEQAEEQLDDETRALLEYHGCIE